MGQTRHGADHGRLSRELADLIDAGMPVQAIEQVLPLWINGTLAQLQNVPADIHIERWLHREFPNLRSAQRVSIMDQATELIAALRPEVQRATPRQVWIAGNAMNYAFLSTMADLLHRPQLIRDFDRRSEVARVGRELVDILDARPDTGLVGDRASTDVWAERLGLETWYEWRRVDELPATVSRMWDRRGEPAVE
jgi:hypothetical protein